MNQRHQANHTTQQAADSIWAVPPAAAATMRRHTVTIACARAPYEVPLLSLLLLCLALLVQEGLAAATQGQVLHTTLCLASLQPCQEHAHAHANTSFRCQMRSNTVPMAG